MAQKKATPNREQMEIIRRAGYNPMDWTVANENQYVMIIANRNGRDFQTILKKKALPAANRKGS